MTRILLVLFLVACLPGFAQTQQITISEENVPLKKVMKLVEDYGKFKFAYRTEYLDNVHRVSVHVKNGTVEQVMEQALKGQGLKYVIVGDGMITVCPDSSAIRNSKPALLAIDGLILSEAGEPLDQVSIQQKGSHTGTTTNFNGQFKISVKPNTLLTFSSVGYEPVVKIIRNESFLVVRLKKHVIDLDETVVMGYGKTSRRYTTGSIYKVNGVDMARQPVSDVLATLQGRIPGLLITQSNGVPGSPYKVQLRGQSSIGIDPGNLPPNDPLFIINGVPYAPNNNPIQGVSSGSALGEFGRSPLSFINISDIDHIEVLKDADATAIYGSRGSNGVILITTKKGKSGPPSITVNIKSGFSQITRYPDMMNTAQYVQMRREALENDGLVLNNQTAPDLISWDTTRYTDFKKMLIGGRAVISNAQLTLSGGSNQIQYYLGAGYQRETTVFPGNYRNERLSGNANLHYQSKDTNLNATLTLIVTGDKNKILVNDLTNVVNLTPHTPVLHDSAGKLNWIEGGLTFVNPMSALLKVYESKTSNLLGNLDINYRIFKNLLFKTSLGYNRLRMEDISLQPGSSLNPYLFPNAKGYSYFGKLIYNSWIAEPQLEYTRYLGIGKISGLLGATMQVQTHSVENIEATNFASDALLRDVHEAGSLTNNDLNTEYRYGGVFARLNSVFFDKYLINLTGRKDGSSRFGAGKQLGTFWSAGVGWIFSNEHIMKNKNIISFGKLRLSYGVTGNDQIGDYKYLDKWQDIMGNYLGNRGINPVQLADSNYSWEVSRKLEAALDLGLFKDRLMISVTWYRNRTGNQLIAYTLPALTGFPSYAAKNSNALVQNSGWEIQLQTKNRLNKHWQWNGNILLTIPRNKLIAFPNLATSSYAHKLTIGESLSAFNGYSYAGVNVATGIFRFNDLDGDGDITFPDDYQIVGHFDPIWYGSLQSNWQYKGWQLEVFFELRKQQALNYLYSIYSVNFPGAILINQPALALNRWQGASSGHAALQQYTTGALEAASKAIERFKESNGGFQDASFCRLKNIELSYRFPAQWLKKNSSKNFRVYLQAQNLFTITSYKGMDPETHNLFTLPPLRTVAAGIELNF